MESKMKKELLPFGKMIKAARKKKNWTGYELLERIGGDFKIEDVTKIEVHGEIPDPWTIGRLAKELELDEKELLVAASENKSRMKEWLKKQREESTVICTYTQEDYDNHQRKATH